jgi:hypothetical protein
VWLIWTSATQHLEKNREVVAKKLGKLWKSKIFSKRASSPKQKETIWQSAAKMFKSISTVRHSLGGMDSVINPGFCEAIQLHTLVTSFSPDVFEALER